MSGASSWLTTLASKAENVLNQIDESAATALHHPHTGPSDKVPGDSWAVGGSTLAPNSQRRSRDSVKKTRKLSTNSMDVNAKLGENEISSRPSSVASSKSNKSEGATPLYVDPFSSARLERLVGEGEGDTQESSPKSGNGGEDNSTSGGSSYMHVDSHPDQSSPPEYESESSTLLHPQMMGEENRLLKSELRSVTQELKAALSRQRETEATLKRLNQDYDLKCHEANEMFRKLQNAEADFAEEMRVRDSQMAAFRVKMDEVNEKIASQVDEIAQLRNDKARILNDSHASSGLHEQSVSHLQSQLRDAQSGFETQLAAERREKQQLQDKLQQTQTNVQDLSQEVRELTSKLQQERESCSDYKRQVASTKQLLEESRAQLEDYKSKAVKILQSKEKLISELKNHSDDPHSSLSSSSVSSSLSQYDMVKMEVSQYRSECELLRGELSRGSVQLETLREELSQTESAHSHQMMSLTQHLQATEDTLKQERHKVALLEDELNRNREELNVNSRQLIHFKDKLSQTVSEKDALISKLQSEVTSLKSKPMSSGNEEFESRIRTLTDTLLSKQSQIERLNSEKQSLNFQLERLALENSQGSSANGSRAGSTRLNMTSLFDEDSLKARGIPAFCRESAFDHQVVKVIKRGLLVVDSFSLSVGVYFRRFALARVLIVIYALLLHLWVTLVILTYKPEMHADDFQPLKPPNPLTR